AISTAAAWSSASSKARAGATVTSCFRPNCSTSCARIGAWRGQCTGCFPGVIPSIRSTAIQACRTSALGGHVEECGDCGLVRQALHHHPHLHCIVPSGGLSPDQTSWISCRPGFFLPVRVLSRRFRRLFLGRLQAAFAAGELRFSGRLAALTDPTAFAGRLADLRGIEWVVYAKRPFA